MFSVDIDIDIDIPVHFFIVPDQVIALRRARAIEQARKRERDRT